MGKSKWRAVVLGSIVIALGCGVACSSSNSSDDSTDGDASTGDSGSGKDASLGSDSGPTDSGITDAAKEAGPICTSNPCVVQIALAGNFSCALLSDKTLRCWGQNESGQLAVGATDDAGGFDAAPYSVPNPITSFTGIDEVATSDFVATHGWTCARAGTADVRCWGADIYSQLGRGDASTFGSATPIPTPGAVVGLPGATFMAGSGGHTCAVVPGGNVSCWGYTVDFALARVTTSNYAPTADFIEGGTANYTQVASGEVQSCALSQTGVVDCWGWNTSNQLGRPDASVSADIVPTTVPNLSGVTDIVGGQNFYCTRTGAGAIDCWGENNLGQLGRGIVSSSDGTPTPVSLPAGRTARLVGAGDESACAVLDDDTVWCWGANSDGQLGSLDDGGNPSDAAGGADSVPRQVAGITGKPLQIAGGRNHFCILIEGGSIQCWGSNSSGQLGRGTGDGGDPDSLPHPDPATVAF